MKVAEYKGEKITWKEAKKRAQYNKDGYVFFISNKLCIDAYRLSGITDDTPMMPRDFPG